MNNNNHTYATQEDQDALSKAWAISMLKKYLPLDAFVLCTERLGFHLEDVIALMQSIGFEKATVDVCIENGRPVIYANGERRVFLDEPASEIPDSETTDEE